MTLANAHAAFLRRFLALVALVVVVASSALAAPTDANHRFERAGVTTDNPVAILPMPGKARILVADRGGDLRLVGANGRVNELLIHLDVSTTLMGEGILGMTWHGAAPGAVLYVSYVSNAVPKKFTVAMLTLDNGVVTGGPTTIWSVNASATATNLGGALGFSADGKLLVGVGDQGTPSAAGQATQNIGKILRLNDDGTVPSDNPLPGRPFFALGVRNPLRISTDFTNARTYFVDACPTGKDELNVLQGSGNYGWPTGSGTLSTPPLIDPIKDWATPIGPNGLSSYRADNFKGTVPGSALVASSTGRILQENWNGLTPATTTETVLFAPGPGDPTSFKDLTVLADGYIYVVAGDNSLWRLRNNAALASEPSSRSSVVPFFVSKDIFGKLVFDVEKTQGVQWYAVYDGDVPGLHSGGYSHPTAIDCHVAPLAPECMDVANNLAPASSAWVSLAAPNAVVPDPPAPPAAVNPPQYFFLTAENGRGETLVGFDSNGLQVPGGEQVFGCPCSPGVPDGVAVGDCAIPWTLNQGLQGAGNTIGPVTFDQDWDCDVILVDYSQGWCYWCHQLAPDLEQLYADYEGNNFTLITLISEAYSARVPATFADVQQWQRDHSSTNPIILDENRRVLNQYFETVICGGFPETQLFNANGEQVEMICGYDPATNRSAVERELRAAGYIP